MVGADPFLTMQGPQVEVGSLSAAGEQIVSLARVSGIAVIYGDRITVLNDGRTDRPVTGTVQVDGVALHPDSVPGAVMRPAWCSCTRRWSPPTMSTSTCRPFSTPAPQPELTRGGPSQ